MAAREVVVVSGDLAPGGGMDRATYELARHLARERRVRVVSHELALPLRDDPHVRWHRVPRPLGRHALGAPLLSWTAGAVAALAARRGAHVIANGGCCPGADVVWVHALHAAWPRRDAHAPAAHRARAAWAKARDRAAERAALAGARLVLVTSERTREDVVRAYGVPPEQVVLARYGTDQDELSPRPEAERAAARRELDLEPGRPVLLFVGALGHDRNKGFDVLFAAFAALCRDPAWDVDLVVAGGGAEVPCWRAEAARARLERRVRVLGRRSDVVTLLAAADALVAPSFYEAYGLAVHEALCCGVPAFVTRTAGVAERYPPDLADLLLDAPPDAVALAARLRAWRADVPGHRARVTALSCELRRRTWSDMAAEVERHLDLTRPAAAGRSTW